MADKTLDHLVGRLLEDDSVLNDPAFLRQLKKHSLPIICSLAGLLLGVMGANDHLKDEPDGTALNQVLDVLLHNEKVFIE